jgi:hypothetical protein
MLKVPAKVPEPREVRVPLVVEGAKLPDTGTARALFAAEPAVCAGEMVVKASRLKIHNSPSTRFLRLIGMFPF